MKRRLSIARSLVNDPELLLLDEPTTGLDPQARHLLWDRLFRLKQQGTTLILTTHYMDEAEQLCDRLVVMDKGRIVAEGSPLQLIREHSTREVLELRFAVDEQHKHVREARRRRRPDRGAARPAAALHRGRRGLAGRVAPARRHPALEPGTAELAGGRLPPASPAAAWWTDVTTAVDAPQRPSAVRPPRAVGLVVEGHFTWYLKNWHVSVVSSVLQPLLALVAFGVFFGRLAAGGSGLAQVTGGVDYLVYLTPGLLCAAALMSATTESSFPVFAGFTVAEELRGDHRDPDHARSSSRSARPPGWRCGCWAAARSTCGRGRLRRSRQRPDRDRPCRVGPHRAGLLRRRRGAGRSIKKDHIFNVHLPVRRGADDAVRRHLLPDRPASRVGPGRRRRSLRSGTAPSSPERPPSAPGSCCPSLGHLAYLLAWTAPASRSPAGGSA